MRWLPVASPLHDPAAVAALAAPWARLLDARGAVRQPAHSPERPDCLLMLTGGTERQALELWGRRPSRALLLLAHSAHNSLPAALETLAALRQRGAAALLVLLDGPGDAAAELAWGIQAVAAHRALQGARLGVIGAPSDWLVASAPSPEVLLASWGLLRVDLPMATLLDGLPSPTTSEAVQQRLEAMVAQHRLAGFTLRCFDLLEQRAWTSCLALARLGAAGLPAGCEGDIPSATALLWLRTLLGGVPWMANPARFTARGLWLAHCTVPLHLVADHRLDTHFESGLGVGVAGRFEPGPVTLLRIGGARMEQLWLCEGQLDHAGSAPDQCRTQAHVRISDAARRELLERPLGNHLVLQPGHHADRLRQWWRCLGPGRV